MTRKWKRKYYWARLLRKYCSTAGTDSHNYLPNPCPQAWFNVTFFVRKYKIENSHLYPQYNNLWRCLGQISNEIPTPEQMIWDILLIR